MIAGFEFPDAGSITLDEQDITRLPPNRRNVGMVFQSYALFPNMTVASNVGFGMRVKKRPKDAIKKRVAELLELINMPEKADKYPYQLSGGQQQRVALARALAIEPQVLLLDEPLSALDAKIRVALRKEIRAIQRQLGITTVYVTHDQEEALSLSDRVVVMSDGRIEQVGTPAEIYNSPATPFVASFVGTLNLLAARVIDASEGRLNVEGQEIRSAKPVTEGGNGSTVTLALRPESLELGEHGGSNQFSGTIEDISFLGSIVRARMRLAEGVLVSFDTFNDPNHRPAVDRRGRRGVVPAGSLPRRRLGPGTRGRRRRGGVTAPSPLAAPRRHRPGRLRQGRHADRLPCDVGRLGALARRAPGRGDPAARVGRRVRGDRVRSDIRTRSPPVDRSRSARCRRSRRPLRRSSVAGARASPRLVARSRPRGSSLIRWRPPCRSRTSWRCSRRCASSGRVIAVATTDHREPTEATLRSLGLRGDVSALACGDDGVGVKPDPAMLLAVCATVAIPPERTAMIGDTPADLEMGRSAGAGRVIGVLSGLGGRDELGPLADVLLPAIGELLD